MGHYAAGAELASVLANTYDAFTEEDLLGSVASLDEFASEQGFGDTAGTDGDLSRLHEARTVLRDAYLADTETEAVSKLNDLLTTASALPRLVATGTDGWEFIYADPAAPLADQLIAASVTQLLEEIRSHGLNRLSTCDSTTCRDVFVDQSRNHSRRYCSPDVCGNRESQRAYRARRADADS